MENPEHLVLSRGKLFCNASREEVILKNSSVRNYTRMKHNEGESKREVREQEIANRLRLKVLRLTYS